MDKKICLKAGKCAKAIIINNKERNVASKTLRVPFLPPPSFRDDFLLLLEKYKRQANAKERRICYTDSRDFEGTKRIISQKR